ncbi:MAG: homocysteine biosynthesis protein [Elusimicrobiota bacterium]|nr:homocysteine biosynthesis protein [Elusimicrobiota bacterium]
MAKTIKDINSKIKSGAVVVVTAEEMVDIVKTEGASAAASRIDVVTTGTFGPMCSSGAFLNINPPRPKMKMQRVFLNNIEVFAGLAAVDVYVGATSMKRDDPLNRMHPGKFLYGGGHLIEDLIAGREVELRATAYGTDCYPGREFTKTITMDDINDAIMFNPRNAYQNYNCAVNSSDKTIYTYMGKLNPDFGNANYCSAGQLSPLLNDPRYRTIGIGTRIFLGGTAGYVAGSGTQHAPGKKRNKFGIPKSPAGTIMVTGNMKEMSDRWVKGVSFIGYGASLMVGIGIPIPVLDEDIAAACGASDEDITCPIVDYSSDYPRSTGKTLGEVSYKELKSGSIKIKGKEVPTGALSSYYRAAEIAGILKEQISAGEFLLGTPQQLLPGG